MYPTADREFRQSFALDPHSALAYTRASFLEVVQGHTDSAYALLHTAQATEPTNVRAAAAGALAAYYGHRYLDALSSSRRALQLDPYFPPALQFEALALSGLGRHSEAIAAARRGGPNPVAMTVVLAIVLAQADSLDAARAIVARLERDVGDKALGPGLLYRAYAALGDADRAFLWLDRAIDERSWFVAFLNVDPVLDRLRSDPRFKHAVSRAGLPLP